MSNKIKILLLLLSFNSTIIAQSSWVYPDDVINNRFLQDALSYPINRPGLSINGFSGSDHGFGVKEILIGLSSNESTLQNVHARLVFTSDLDITYSHQIINGLTLDSVTTNYNINARVIEARAYVALLTYIIERNGSTPAQFGISRTHSEALQRFKESFMFNGTIENRLVSWDLVKRFNPTYSFTEGKIDFVKFTQSFMNMARALDLYLGLENAYQFFGSKCTPNNPLISYCDSVAQSDYANSNSSVLLSHSQKTALFQKYGDSVKDFHYMNNATIAELNYWYPPSQFSYQYFLSPLIMNIGQHIELRRLQPGNWSLKNFVGTGYGAMAMQVSNQNEMQQYENMYDKALSILTVQSVSNRELYWNYQTNNGQSYWAEGPYYMHYSFREVMPFLHAVRMNNTWNPNSNTPDPFYNDWFLKPLNWLANIATPDGSTPPLDDSNKHPMRHSDMLRWAPTYGDAVTGRKFAKINDAIHEYWPNATRYATESSVLLVTLAIPRISDDQNVVISDLTNSTNDDQQLVIRRRSKGKDIYILLNGERGSAITRGEGHEQPDQLQLLIYADDQSLIGDSGYDLGGVFGNSHWNEYKNNNNLVFNTNHPTGGLDSPFLSELLIRKVSEHASVSNLLGSVDGRLTILNGSVTIDHYNQIGQLFQSAYTRTVLYIDEDPLSGLPGYVVDFNTNVRGFLNYAEQLRFDVSLKYTIPGVSANSLSSTSWNRYQFPDGYLSLYVQPIEWGIEDQTNPLAYVSNTSTTIREYNGYNYAARRFGLRGTNPASRSWTSMSILWFDNPGLNQPPSPISQPQRLNVHLPSNAARDYSAWYLQVTEDVLDVYVKRAYPDGYGGDSNEINISVPILLQSLKLVAGKDYGFARFRKHGGFWFPDHDYLVNIESNATYFDNSTTITNASYPSGSTIMIANGKTLTINGQVSFDSGTTVLLGANSKIVVTASGNITSNATVFSSVDHTNPATAYDRIEINSNGNTFVKTTFRGGNNQNVLVKQSGNLFTECVFSHSKVGLSLFTVAAEAILVGSTITQNTQHGAYVDGGTLRLNGYTRSLPSNPYWNQVAYNPSSVHSNGGNGVTLIGTGKLFTSHSRVMDNAGIQISVGNDARLYAQELNSDGNLGLNRITNELSGFYIYSTARTQSGETFQSWTIPANMNYWGAAGEPVQGRFFGPVDATFKLDSDETEPSIMLTCAVSDCDDRPEPGQIASILSSAMAQSIANGSATSAEAYRRISTKDRLLAIRNHLANHPADPFNARLLREWHGLLQEPGASVWSDEKQHYASHLEMRRSRHATDMAARQAGSRTVGGRAADTPSEGDPADLIGETAWVLSLADLAERGQFEPLLIQAGSYAQQVLNADNRASVHTYRMQALQGLGRYDEAITALNDLERIQPSRDMKPHYIEQDLRPLRQYLADLAGVDVEATYSKSMAAAEADAAPHAFALHPTYPNPFNPTTTVRYSVGGANGSSVPVRIAVYDLLGREVAVLVDERKAAGEYTHVLDASAIASGIYLIHAQLGSQPFSQKVTLIK